MEFALTSLAIVLLVIVTGAGWVLTLLGMPGNWLMVAAAALYAWLGPQSGVTSIGWPAVGMFAVVAAVGEAIESAAGIWGAKRAGGSRRAAWFSLIGSFAGAILGAGLGAPLPVVGSLAGAVFGSALGAMGGAALAEYTLGENHHHSWRVGRAAFSGRLLGTGAKAVVASALAITILVGLIW